MTVALKPERRLIRGRKRAVQTLSKCRVPTRLAPRQRVTGSPWRPLQGETQAVIRARRLRSTRRERGLRPTNEGLSTDGGAGVAPEQLVGAPPTIRKTAPPPEIA